MAKTSMVEREKKRARTVAKYAKKRAALKAIINNRNASDEERWDDGEDVFFTGLKPERGPAYADFQMDAGKGYIIDMPGRADPSSDQLVAVNCTADNGEPSLISYRAVFLPAG